MANRLRIIGWHHFTPVSGGTTCTVPTYAHPRPQLIRTTGAGEYTTAAKGTRPSKLHHARRE